MKTAGLIFIWFAMTVILVFWHTNIENMRSFFTIYAMLVAYLVYIARLYIKKRNSEREE